MVEIYDLVQTKTTCRYEPLYSYVMKTAEIAKKYCLNSLHVTCTVGPVLERGKRKKNLPIHFSSVYKLLYRTARSKW